MNFFSSIHKLETLHSKKFQKTLILAFEANSVFSCQNAWTFSRVRAHWCLSDEASNLFFDTFHYLSISYFSSWYAKTFPLPYLNGVNNLIETIAKVPNEVLVLLVVLEESFDFACKNKWKMMDLWSKQDESGGNEIIQ